MSPRRMAKTGELATRTDQAGIAHPLSAAYQVRIAIDAADRPVLLAHRAGLAFIARPSRSWRGCAAALRGSFHFAV